jgi:hypothetical protein
MRVAPGERLADDLGDVHLKRVCKPDEDRPPVDLLKGRLDLSDIALRNPGQSRQGALVGVAR